MFTHKIATVTTCLAGQRRLHIEVDKLSARCAKIELRQDAQDQVCEHESRHQVVMMSSYILMVLRICQPSTLHVMHGVEHVGWPTCCC